jgi:hypothetical protein
MFSLLKIFVSLLKFYLVKSGGALEGFNIGFDSSKMNELDSDESIRKQKAQPCTQACYNDASTAGKEDGSLFSISSL